MMIMTIGWWVRSWRLLLRASLVAVWRWTPRCVSLWDITTNWLQLPPSQMGNGSTFMPLNSPGGSTRRWAQGELLLSAFPFSHYCVTMICMDIVTDYQLWWTLLYLVACLFHLFQFITTVYLLLANEISDLICLWWYSICATGCHVKTVESNGHNNGDAINRTDR